MKKRKIPHQKRNGDTSPPRRFSIGRIAYMAFLCPTVSLMFSQPAFAATDVWTKATEIMQDVYTQILASAALGFHNRREQFLHRLATSYPLRYNLSF